MLIDLSPDAGAILQNSHSLDPGARTGPMFPDNAKQGCEEKRPISRKCLSRANAVKDASCLITQRPLLK